MHCAHGADHHAAGDGRAFPDAVRADSLFIVQIILYAGGIMVLFVFVIMLVNLDVAMQAERSSTSSGSLDRLALACARRAVVLAVYRDTGRSRHLSRGRVRSRRSN